jgi:hypothetical protein
VECLIDKPAELVILESLRISFQDSLGKRCVDGLGPLIRERGLS